MVKVAGIECGTQGYGLMGFNLPPNTPVENAIPVMKAAVEAGNTFWSSAEYYGTPEYNSLHVLHAYFTKYPEDADKVCLFMKIGFDSQTASLKTDEASLRASVEYCERILAGTKRIDVLSMARVDPNIPIETTVGILHEYVQAGRVGAVGMSECSAATLRRAAKVCPIMAVEVEFSMFTTDIIGNGVAEAAREVGTVIAAYSPLGRGMLTGTITSETMAEDDPRRNWPRFKQDVLENNLKLVREVEKIAQRYAATNGQIALAWIRAHSGKEGFPVILPIPGTKSVKRLEENVKEVQLSVSDVEELDEMIRKNPIMGDRYPAAVNKLSWG